MAYQRKISCPHRALSQWGNNFPLCIPLQLQHFVMENIENQYGRLLRSHGLSVDSPRTPRSLTPFPLGTVFFRVHKIVINLLGNIHNYMLSRTNVSFHHSVAITPDTFPYLPLAPGLEEALWPGGGGGNQDCLLRNDTSHNHSIWMANPIPHLGVEGQLIAKKATG